MQRRSRTRSARGGRRARCPRSGSRLSSSPGAFCPIGAGAATFRARRVNLRAAAGKTGRAPLLRVAAMQSERILIAGEWRDGADGAVFDTVDPATGERLATCAEASAADVDA